MWSTWTWVVGAWVCLQKCPYEVSCRADDACPIRLAAALSDPSYEAYFGSSRLFHCGCRVLVKRCCTAPDGDRAFRMNECVYGVGDGRLIRYSPLFKHAHHNACGGTPDQHNARYCPLQHAMWDDGGIWSPAALHGLYASTWRALSSLNGTQCPA